MSPLAATSSCATRPAPYSTYKTAELTCPECAEPFETKNRRALFCDAKCKQAFHNRSAARGKVLVPLQIVARQTRQGTRGNKALGKEATQRADQLLQRWQEEDRTAGRMEWQAYLALSMRLGHRDEY